MVALTLDTTETYTLQLPMSRSSACALNRARIADE
jgi:hypothetical protein